MAAYILGDRDAFDMLFTRLAPRLHGFFWRAFLTEAIADELLKQTSLKVHRSRLTYKPEMRVATWAFTIAGIVRLDEHRKRRRLGDVGDDESRPGAGASSAAVLPLFGVMGANPAEIARLAVESLPEVQRLVVHLHRLEDLSFAEISGVLRTTEGSVKLCAFQAYATLRKLLAVTVSEA